MTPAPACLAAALTHSADSALGQEAARLLRAAGVQVHEIPLIEFGPPAWPQQKQVQQRLAELGGPGSPDWLLLTSGQGVRAVLRELTALGLGPEQLARLRVAAVGQATAHLLSIVGRSPDFVPSRAGAAYLGAELPAAPGAVALHLTSPLAEDALRHTLSARGICYERLEVYQTRPALLDSRQVMALAQAQVITLASGSAAQHLGTLLAHPQEQAIVALGPQTAQAAQQAGFQRVLVAAQATPEALARAVLDALAHAG